MILLDSSLDFYAFDQEVIWEGEDYMNWKVRRTSPIKLYPRLGELGNYVSYNDPGDRTDKISIVLNQEGYYYGDSL